jgi:hypothetical protein
VRERRGHGVAARWRWRCVEAPQPDGKLRCQVHGGVLEADRIAQICAVSLIAEVDGLRCLVYL